MNRKGIIDMAIKTILGIIIFMLLFFGVRYLLKYLGFL